MNKNHRPRNGTSMRCLWSSKSHTYSERDALNLMPLDWDGVVHCGTRAATGYSAVDAVWLPVDLRSFVLALRDTLTKKHHQDCFTRR